MYRWPIQRQMHQLVCDFCKHVPSRHVVGIELIQSKEEKHVHVVIVVGHLIGLSLQLPVEVLLEEVLVSGAQSTFSNKIHLALESMMWLGFKLDVLDLSWQWWEVVQLQSHPLATINSSLFAPHVAKVAAK